MPSGRPMSTTMADKPGGVFRLPFKGILGDEPPDILHKDVCVIGLFGRSPMNGKNAKALSLNTGIGRTVFQTLEDNHQQKSQQNDSSCYTECYYDHQENIVYVHLVSVYDVPMIIRLCHRMQQHLSHSEIHEFLKSEETQHARALLHLFSICHIILVNEPKCCLDLSLVQLFRALENTRQKLLPLLTDTLCDLPVSKEWQNYGRMCTPRLLFICQQSHLVSENMSLETESDPRGINKGRSRKWTPIQRLQHSLEDQIYRVFRKSRILTNNLSHCLFSLPANQPYVHITSQCNTTPDPIDFLIGQISQQDTNTGPKLSNYKYTMQSTKMSSISVIDGMPRTEDKTMTAGSLKAFLWEHVKLVHTKKAFDDNISRNSTTSPHFEVPRFNKWLEVANKLYDFFLCDDDDDDDEEEEDDESEGKKQTYFDSLQSALDLDMRFSEARCAKVLPLASRTYQENASSHYTSIVHDTKFSQALRVYRQHARGPAYEKYEDQLQEECLLFWQNGRQLCEIVSLTGHHCTHKLHLLPDDVVDADIDARLPRRHHTNNNHTPAACNCGRVVVQRDDPFELKVANYEFFQDLAERCCSKLKHFSFKVYEPRRKESKALLLLENLIKEEEQKEGAVPTTTTTETASKVPEKVNGAESAVTTTEATASKVTITDKLKWASAEQTGSIPTLFSPALSLGQSGAGGTIDASVLSNDAGGGMPGESSAGLLSMLDNVSEAVRDKLLLGELSGMGFLHGMLCSTSPRGLLPTFPSWSLVCLGKGNVYSPIKGLDHPGFLRDSNYLLPWDIPVPKGSTLDGRAWPSPSESGGGRKGGKHRDKRSHKDSGADSSLRAYIGNEYECPRGHRFICSAPDKIVKATERSGVKETGNKLVTMDMPLYSPCACRSSKPPLGQLMRLFVVTPDTSLYIKLNPRVRPGAHPCPVFYPEPKGEGMTLPRHTMWVLRFPFVYVDESGPILPPTDNQPPPGAKMMKGVYLTTLKAPET